MADTIFPTGVDTIAIYGGTGNLDDLPTHADRHDLMAKAIMAIESLLAAGGGGIEIVAHKGQANGYAGLDSGGHVPSAQLPSGLGTGTGQTAPRIVSTNTTMLATDSLLVVDATAGNVAITLPQTPIPGCTYGVVKLDGSANTVTVGGFGVTPPPISGATTDTLTSQYLEQGYIYDSVGVRWFRTSTSRQGPTGPGGAYPYLGYSDPAPAAATTFTFREDIEANCTLTLLRLTAGTAPVGSAFTGNLVLNGTAIWSSGFPSIAAGATASAAVVPPGGPMNLNVGDQLQFRCEAQGSTTPATNVVWRPFGYLR